ncbi:GNAT family N-acetyltransferase [Priestia megaterium]|uniref:GNAT family N-acetyltransferase n=1 Tax=Priestia megaterium TaxID=1404 RepID=UPI00244676DE|nr:GNAT family N-acetyltransferase [Priestia megaterium]MEE3897264.1 GNAT family N-acetyltransferase [Priestia megaterium]WRQ95677.1 GNAT family N-acetyltransferase [Priestia megaterium]
MKHSIVLNVVDIGNIEDLLFIKRATQLLQKLVSNGAAIGWVDPPSTEEVAGLLRELVISSGNGNAYLIVAWVGPDLAGIGYWRRYNRPTHRPHANIEKVAIDPRYQGHGLGRQLMNQLISSAVNAGVEMLTLDFRGDNERAAKLYKSLGFTEYGRLPRFVAVGTARYDKMFYALDLR